MRGPGRRLTSVAFGPRPRVAPVVRVTILHHASTTGRRRRRGTTLTASTAVATTRPTALIPHHAMATPHRNAGTDCSSPGSVICVPVTNKQHTS